MHDSDEYVSQSQADLLRFTEEYQEHRRLGYGHDTAMNRARDYYNKFTAHELTANWQSAADAVTCHTDDIEDRINFNQVVAQILKVLTPRQIDAFWHLIAQQELEEWLSDELFAQMQQAVRFRPLNAKEMAEALGLASNNINVCTPLTRLKARIRSKCAGLGFVPGVFA